MFFTIEKLERQIEEIRRSIHREQCDIPFFKYFESPFDGPGNGPENGPHCPEFDDRGWADFRVGQEWGGYDRQAWFRAWVDVPPEWRDERLSLRFVVGPRDGGDSTAETMLYVNGAPLQALDVWHEEAWLPPEITRPGRFLVALKAWSGVLGVPARRRFKQAQLVRIDPGAERFYYRSRTVLKALQELDANDLRRTRLLQALNEAIHCVDFTRPAGPGFYASLQAADNCLQAGLAALPANGEIKPAVVGVGHAHIDMAWLWRLDHSREKASRTFTTALHLMRQYPEYHFMHSSPQLYQFLKEDYPEIYARVKERIAAGQWEVTGGMWVEADTNLTGGESLIRQFLLGRLFVRQEFGVEMKTLWLPDVFGYSAALPQIARKCGMEYFLTTKISWSQFNRFPYDTFWWRGLDGTQMLTHFVTTPDKGSPFYTYNGRLEPAEVKGLWDSYQQKEANSELLDLFGWGDGGGGPTKEMLESAAGLADLPGMPRVELGKAEPYLSRLAGRVAGQGLPVWDGELYLEYHRGTYTSQAYNKRANRQAEILYHNAEWLSALADVLLGEQAYPGESLRAGWERILLNQFHDILPGSSIRAVYEDCHRDYARIAQTGELALEGARERLVERIASGGGTGLTVFNSLSWPRAGLVELPASSALAEAAAAEAGSPAPRFQSVAAAGGEANVLAAVEDVPGLGFATYPLDGAAPAAPDLPGGELRVAPDCLENGYYRIELNTQGQITRLWDKLRSREVLAPGARGNVFQAFEDKPMNFDAWDIDIYYQEKMRSFGELVAAEVEEAGPLRGVLRLTWRDLDSTITQRMTIYRRSPRIDFRTEVDWHARQVLLKVAFPVDVRATRATYDIQFGSVERPTHWNTSWDWARFEVVGHKWADLSEGDYGVALLNDCKYGYDIKDNVMRLTLIKSAIDPDPEADQGRHEFTYSLLPHAGDWRSGGVVREAYELNVPLLARELPAAGRGPALPQRAQFAVVDAENVILETVKRAEEGDGWVVRMYEYKQSRSRAVRVRFARPLARAVACNLVEEEDQPVAFEGDTLEFGIAPFEIKTFKVWF